MPIPQTCNTKVKFTLFLLAKRCFVGKDYTKHLSSFSDYMEILVPVL